MTHIEAVCDVKSASESLGKDRGTQLGRISHDVLP